MKYPTVFHLTSVEFAKEGIACILIGGFAVNYHGVTRQTADVDFLVAKNNGPRVKDLLVRLGYRESLSEQDIFLKFECTGPRLLDIDIMLVNEATFSKVSASGIETEIAENKFVVPCLDHLIALKLHSIRYNPRYRRFKDLPDIIELVRANNVNVETEEFEEMCLEYGTEELYGEIRETLAERS